MSKPLSANQACRTLGDVIHLVEQHPDLPPSRRRDFLSAIDIVSRRFLQRSPDQVPADAQVLRVQLSKLHWAAFNMKKPRYGNIRADLWGALRLADAPGLLRGP